MKNVLILGADGLIGHQFTRVCGEAGITHTGTCYTRRMEGSIYFDQSDLANIPLLLDRVSPTVVVDAIGLAGGVNFCESHPETGRKYHVDATIAKADWCREHGAAFAFISTDYVFDGKNPPYKEDDAVNPLNSYGALKLEAEQYIQVNLERYVIARTTNVFGWDPQTETPNFLMHLVNTLKEQDSIKVPSFLYGNPTYAGDLAAGIMDLLEKENFGLYHLVGPENISRYRWAEKCIAMAGFTGKTIEPVEQPPENMVPRPLLSHLDTAKFNGVSRIKLHNVDEGLKIFVNEMKA